MKVCRVRDVLERYLLLLGSNSVCCKLLGSLGDFVFIPSICHSIRVRLHVLYLPKLMPLRDDCCTCLANSSSRYIKDDHERQEDLCRAISVKVKTSKHLLLNLCPGDQ